MGGAFDRGNGAGARGGRSSGDRGGGRDGPPRDDGRQGQDAAPRDSTPDCSRARDRPDDMAELARPGLRAHRSGRGESVSRSARPSAAPDVTLGEAMENVDIGGPTLIRAAAKNHRDVWVAVDPGDYGAVLEAVDGKREWGAGERDGLRRRLAAKVFREISSYDRAVANLPGGRRNRGGALTARRLCSLTEQSGRCDAPAGHAGADPAKPAAVTARIPARTPDSTHPRARQRVLQDLNNCTAKDCPTIICWIWTAHFSASLPSPSRLSRPSASSSIPRPAGWPSAHPHRRFRTGPRH